MNRRLLSIVLLAALSACPGVKPNPGNGVPEFRGLKAIPEELAFTCVVPGCDTTLKVQVVSTVNRRVAIKRVVLSDSTVTDFVLTPDMDIPGILGAASAFTIDVRHVPLTSPTAHAINLLVTYVDASGDPADPDRIDPGELVIPLVKRLVGEPVLAVRPGRLSFGVVPVGTAKALPLKVRNEGFGNISLDVNVADAGLSAFKVQLPAGVSLLPDAGVDVPVSYAPQTEEYVRSVVDIGSTTPGVRPVPVTVEATSYATPRLAVEPEELALDFGNVKKGTHASATLTLANHGGATLNVSQVSVADSTNTVTASLDGGATSTTLAALERQPLTLNWLGTTPGPVAATLQVNSNDPARPLVTVPIVGTVTQPQIQITPASIDFATVPMGWVLTRPVEIRNVGWGPLTVKSITMVGGSSTLYTLQNVPQLPLKLERDQRIVIDVEFRAESAASFTGAISVETDDPVTPFSEVALTATGGSCAAGCPIANGTPDCSTTGACTVGTCNPNYYDTDNDPSTGCECHEPVAEIGDFCSGALNKGTLTDISRTSATYTGILPTPTDVDFIMFFGEDSSTGQLFGDNYDVHITLATSDPHIKMCVYRYDTASAVGECYLNNETCTSNYSRSGSWGSEDGAMYYIKIFRDSGGPTCTPYTVAMSNG